MPNFLCFLRKLIKLSVDQKFSAVWQCLLERNYQQLPVQKTCFKSLYLPLLIHKYSYKTLTMASNRYCIDLAKRGQAGCKKCKQKIDKGLLRIGKIVPSPFGDPGSEMKLWYHIRCMFEQQLRARATTKKIEGPEDLEGWDDIDADFQEDVLKCMEEFSAKAAQKTPKKSPRKAAEKATPQDSPQTSGLTSLKSPVKPTSPGKDDTFREFRRLCAVVSEDPSHTGKTSAISDFFKNGPDGSGFKGDIHLWVKMLLPGVNKRVYNLQSKQLVKLFSQIFCTSQEDMLEDLEQGDIAETIRIFFEKSKTCPPVKKSSLMLQEVDNFLDKLKAFTKEEDQIYVLRKVTERCTVNDLKMFVRLIKHDLRINAGPKPILDALHPTAYQAFQASRNLEDVVNRVLKQREVGNLKKELSVRTSLMTPILPMLAEPCRSVEYAFKKCPNGLLVEIKYDGERVQVHKRGDEFNYFSRSLKPVMAHKVAHLKDFIPKAFPHGNDLILDSEVLLVDTDGKPLPFGTLGVHKKSAFKDANVCLFVFDCIQFNDQVLLDEPLTYRRKILQENMMPIKNHIMFSEMKPVYTCGELKEMIHSVIQQGLEGLIIKDKKSIYEPGKRHWLKVKKDYLEKGAMADSADLVVLGAYFGTGIKGGMMSVFLMGCFNKKTEKWCTVTKVHGGHDDATLHRLQTELEMVKISKDPSKVPDWLNINKMLIPDFVTKDPKKSPVWEITGAEFTKAEVHTAGGISIRFPRVTHIRDDKSWHEATNLQELQKLYKKSKETTDMIGLSSVSHNERNKNDTNSGSGVGPGSATAAVEDDDDDNDDNYYNETDVDSDIEMIDEKLPTERKSPKVSNAKRKIQFEPKPTIDSVKKENKIESDNPIKKLKQDQVSSPQADSTGKQKSQLPIFKCSFPDVFTGVKLFLPSSIDQIDKLRRYFIAYDGDLLDDHEVENSTHLIVLGVKTNIKYPRGAERVTVDWLWDSIKLQRLLPVDMYKPVAS